MGLCAGGKLRSVGDENGTFGYAFWCPGCDSSHYVTTKSRLGRVGDVWGFNGDTDKPTFTPSLLVRSGHYLPHHKADGACWCTYNRDHPDDAAPFKCECCHSFITDGKIQFLGDSSHRLANQTVDIPLWPESKE